MMIFIVLMSVIAHVVGYAIYASRVFNSEIKPNSASWGIWAFGALLESGTYVFATNDIYKDLLPVVCAVAAISLFVICLFKGKFSAPDKFDYYIIFLDCVILLYWILFDSAVNSNLLVVTTAVISFVPIIRSAWSDPEDEDSLPWYIWSFAYLLLVVVVIMRWEKWQDIVYPVTYFFLHILVALASTKIIRNKVYKSESIE